MKVYYIGYRSTLLSFGYNRKFLYYLQYIPEHTVFAMVAWPILLTKYRLIFIEITYFFTSITRSWINLSVNADKFYIVCLIDIENMMTIEGINTM